MQDVTIEKIRDTRFGESCYRCTDVQGRVWHAVQEAPARIFVMLVSDNGIPPDMFPGSFYTSTLARLAARLRTNVPGMEAPMFVQTRNPDGASVLKRV